MNLGVRTFIKTVDNNEMTRGWFIEKACLCQQLKRHYNEGFDLDHKRLGEDKWVAFNGPENSISNLRKVQGDLVSNGSNERVDIAARRIIP